MANDDVFGSDLLAVAAHEMKAPISAVRGYIELVEQVGELNDMQLRYCNRALDALERMEEMIASMLEMARLEKGGKLEFADCDLGAIMRSAVDLVEPAAQRRGVAVNLTVDDDLGLVSGDRRLLGQVVSNLLTNAVKYNQENGTIWVTVSNQPEFVQVDVRDNGLGIPDKDQPYVFDAFFRAGNSAKTRASGSGLGLAIVRAVIHRHQGYIWLKSAEGQGSTFSFTIPRKDRRREGIDLISEAESSSGEGSDLRHRGEYEPSIEEADDVDDNTQESRGHKEIDSSSDVV
jgi:two-component system phosphate regulon sensor histidine kinase PhoR